MLLHDSRRDARLDEAGDLVVLEEQDRSRWDQQQIAEALPLVEEALRGGPGPFALQAAIAAAALSGGAGRRYGLAADRPALRSSRAPAALAHRVAEPRRGGRDGGRPAAGARAHRCARRHRRSRRLSPAACRARRSAAPRSDPRRKRRRATRERWRWSPMTASADFSSGGCARSTLKLSDGQPRAERAGPRVAHRPHRPGWRRLRNWTVCRPVTCLKTLSKSTPARSTQWNDGANVLHTPELPLAVQPSRRERRRCRSVPALKPGL